MNEEMMMNEEAMNEDYEATETQESSSIGMLVLGACGAAAVGLTIGLVKKFNNPEKKATRCEARLAKKHAKMIAAMEREGFVVMPAEAYQEIQDEVQADESEEE